MVNLHLIYCKTGSHRKAAVEEIQSRSINMQSVMSVIIYMNENKLKRKGLLKLLSDLEHKKTMVRVTQKECN